MSTERPGFLTAYAKHAGISRQAAKKQLVRAGIDYLQPFDFKRVDRLLNEARHLSRDPYRKRRVTHG